MICKINTIKLETTLFVINQYKPTNFTVCNNIFRIFAIYKKISDKKSKKRLYRKKYVFIYIFDIICKKPKRKIENSTLIIKNSIFI